MNIRRKDSGENVTNRQLLSVSRSLSSTTEGRQRRTGRGESHLTSTLHPTTTKNEESVSKSHTNNTQFKILSPCLWEFIKVSPPLTILVKVLVVGIDDNERGEL